MLSRSLVMDIGPDTAPCPAVDKYQRTFLTADSAPIDPKAARIVLGIDSPSIAEEAKLIDSLRNEVAAGTAGISAAPTGVPVLAAAAHDTLAGRLYLFNLVPLAVVALILLLMYRQPRRALLPVLPPALAAGWLTFALLLLGRLPGGTGTTLGALTPLTAMAGALVVVFGVHAGVVVQGRFDAALERGLKPDDAAAAALAGARRTVLVPGLALAAAFAILALSGLFPGGVPLVAGFGLVMVIGLALALAAVFAVMLPLAVASARRAPAAVPAAAKPRRLQPAPVPKRAPGVSGRRRTQRESPDSDVDESDAAQPAPETRPGRRPGVSGRRRPPRGRGQR
jgi:uncharacterized membrane protein YdfJ with MMPL/SSD domain